MSSGAASLLKESMEYTQNLNQNQIVSVFENDEVYDIIMSNGRDYQISKKKYEITLDGFTLIRK